MSVFRPRRSRRERISDAEIELLSLLASSSYGPRSEAHFLIAKAGVLPEKRGWVALARLVEKGHVVAQLDFVTITDKGRRALRPRS